MNRFHEIGDDQDSEGNSTAANPDTRHPPEAQAVSAQTFNGWGAAATPPTNDAAQLRGECDWAAQRPREPSLDL
jgi:hypothetical protein